MRCVVNRLPKAPQAYSEILVAFPPRSPMPLPQDRKWPGLVSLARKHLDEIAGEARAERAQVIRAAALSLLRAAIAPFRAVAQSWHAWRKRERDLEELTRLDDRALGDMEITRYDALMADKGDRYRA